jgi:hypothetical protein
MTWTLVYLSNPKGGLTGYFYFCTVLCAAVQGKNKIFVIVKNKNPLGHGLLSFVGVLC